MVPVKGNRVPIRVARVPASPPPQRRPTPTSATAATGAFGASTEVGSPPPTGLSNSATNIVYNFSDTRSSRRWRILQTLTTSSDDPANILSFNVADIPPSYGRLRQTPHINPGSEMVAPPSADEFKTQEMTVGYLGHQVEFTGMEQNRMTGGHAAAHGGATGGVDQGLFDLTGSIDQAYWSEAQWANNYDDQSLNYLP
ncbi:Uncharacterized protein Adt_40922 [Abeliophyllum distichum]|uniref:Uncharacterized protein n=1 Tax=Abeliophyllum distichum TaxID=126358 RepID=A0ABD1PR98_9LAMI